jgi:hypothetical protein
VTTRSVEKKKTKVKKESPRKEPIDIPPVSSKRTFNENDIFGELDRDKQGKVILMKNKQGKLVDKKGRKINE